MSSKPRKPIYNKDRDYRVVSVANGRWLLQHLNADVAPTREIDPWQSIGFSTDDLNSLLLKPEMKTA